MSLLLGLGGGAYARDKSTSARLCAKNAEGGGVFVGHYGTLLKTSRFTKNCTILTKRNARLIKSHTFLGLEVFANHHSNAN